MEWSRTSFRSSLVPMVLADDDRRYVAANQAACLLLRVAEPEVRTMRIDDLTAPENRSQVPRLWDAFIRDGVQAGRFELLMPDGAQLTVDYSATANVEPGRHLSILMFPATRSDSEPVESAGREPLLTNREREVLGMIASGLGSSGIAAELGVAPSTVETHVRNTLEKLGARNRAHAIALGLHVGELVLDIEDVAT